MLRSLEFERAVIASRLVAGAEFAGGDGALRVEGAEFTDGVIRDESRGITLSRELVTGAETTAEEVSPGGAVVESPLAGRPIINKAP